MKLHLIRAGVSCPECYAPGFLEYQREIKPGDRVHHVTYEDGADLYRCEWCRREVIHTGPPGECRITDLDGHGDPDSCQRPPRVEYLCHWLQHGLERQGPLDVSTFGPPHHLRDELQRLATSLATQPLDRLPSRMAAIDYHKLAALALQLLHVQLRAIPRG